MKLSRVCINNLFEQFDYTIELNQEEGITILTGPNGYGKTTILNIIYNLFNKGFKYILSVPFKEISLDFDNGYALSVIMKIEQAVIISRDGDIIVSRDKEKLVGAIEILYFTLTDKNGVCDVFEFHGQKFENDQNPVLKLLESIKVYIIKDQRLAYTTVPKMDGTFKMDGSIKLDGATVLVNTITAFSNKLEAFISQKKREEQQLADKLASSQHNRIKALPSPLSESEFRERFNALRKRYRQLHNMGIYTVDLEDTGYDDNKGYLSVFLEDWENRVSIYDDLLSKIDLFLSTLNKKELSHKTTAVKAGEGLCFVTDAGKHLELADLSSGEQHQTILLYELLDLLQNSTFEITNSADEIKSETESFTTVAVTVGDNFEPLDEADHMLIGNTLA